MPTKVIDSEGKPRNWPTDFTSEIKNTIAGSKEEKFDFGNNSIAALASRSAKSTLIEFDNDAFVEEGKTYLEKIENDKILDLGGEYDEDEEDNKDQLDLFNVSE